MINLLHLQYSFSYVAMKPKMDEMYNIGMLCTYIGDLYEYKNRFQFNFRFSTGWTQIMNLLHLKYSF